jgi:hypothetical protein
MIEGALRALSGRREQHRTHTGAENSTQTAFVSLRKTAHCVAQTPIRPSNSCSPHHHNHPQGRGLSTHAFTHSLETNHHMFMKLDNGKVGPADGRSIS